MKNPLAVMSAMLVRSEASVSKLRAETKGSVRVIEMYGVIGESFWEDGITAREVSVAVAGPETDIICRINSPGGSSFEGIAIYNILKSSGKNIKVIIDGVAASAASVIAMAGDSIEMGTGTMMMIHEAWTYTIGSAADMEKTAAILRKVTSSSVDIYAAKTGKKTDEIAALLAAETWLSADEAVEMGFANVKTDSQAEVEEIAQAFDFAAMYQNAPETLKMFKQPAAVEVEAAEESESIETSEARLALLALL
jgi:ATP-dependent protease ClpP protease subunit